MSDTIPSTSATSLLLAGRDLFENDAMQTRVILWGALLFSSVLYLGVLLAVAKTSEATPEPFLAIALGVAAINALAVGVILPPRTLKQSLSKLTFTTEESGNFASEGAGVRYFAAPDEARVAAAAPLQTASILRLALFEAVALIGFVLGFLGYPPAIYLVFFVAAWAAIGSQFPTRARDDAAITAATGIRFR